MQSAQNASFGFLPGGASSGISIVLVQARFDYRFLLFAQFPIIETFFGIIWPNSFGAIWHNSQRNLFWSPLNCAPIRWRGFRKFRKEGSQTNKKVTIGDPMFAVVYLRRNAGRNCPDGAATQHCAPER